MGVLIVVLGGSGAAWAMTRSSGSTSSSTQVVAAKRTTINETVSTSGTIAASKEADLSFGASGRVTSVKVAEGDKVTKGQVLATVGADALQAQYDAARAAVTSAKDSVSESSGDAATAVTAAKSALVAAHSTLATARTALHDAKLRATISGTVTSVDLTKGESVTGSSSTSSGSSDSSAGSSGLGTGSSSTGSSSSDSSSSSSSDVVIQATKSYIVNATVDDTEVKTVKKGQTVAITPDGATSSVTGRVTSISSVPSTSSDVVTFPVVVKVSGHPSGVYSGASATLVITTKHTANVLEIPTLAITYSGSTASVKVRSGGSTATRTITVGTSYGLETQVVSGLTAGEDVVVTIPSFGGRPGGTGGTGGEGGFPTRTGEGGFGGGTGTGTGSGGEGGGFSNAPGGFGGGGG